jgi:hypothetical protein
MSGFLSAGIVGGPDIPDSGVSRWAFDEGSGSTAIDEWGGNDASIVGATYTTASQVGSHALEFDGVGDEVNAGDPADGSLDFGTGDFSIAVWVNINDLQTNRVLAAKNNSQSGDGWSFEVLSDGRVAWYRGNGATANNLSQVADSTLSTSTWYLLTATIDYNTEVSIYINDAEASYSNIYSNWASVSNSYDFRIGRHEGLARDMDGKMDDPRIFDKELSSTEVSNLYNTGNISG